MYCGIRAFASFPLFGGIFLYYFHTCDRAKRNRHARCKEKRRRLRAGHCGPCYRHYYDGILAADSDFCGFARRSHSIKELPKAKEIIPDKPLFVPYEKVLTFTVKTNLRRYSVIELPKAKTNPFPFHLHMKCRLRLKRICIKIL